MLAARRWAGYQDEALDRFPDSEVMFFSHHWPVWGKTRIAAMLSEQRDTYRYIHDQTLRLANQSLGPRDIAEQLTRPMRVKVITQQAGIKDLVDSPDLSIDGSLLDQVKLFSLIDKPDPVFPIVLPKE